MKKLMYFCCVILFGILALLAVINYPMEVTERIESGKETIQIQKPEGVSNEEFLENIDGKMEEIHSDLMYRYIDVKQSQEKCTYYRTYHTDDFLKGNAGKNNKVDDITIEFYPLKDANVHNLSSNIYFVRYEDVSKVIDAISELGYSIEEKRSTLQSGQFKVSIFAAIPILMFFASIVFYVLSIAREVVLKKLDGYGNADLTIEFVKKTLPVFTGIVLIWVCVFGSIGIFAKNIKLICDFLLFLMQYIAIGIMVMLVGYLVAIVVFAGYRSAEQIKGKTSRKLMYTLSSFMKMCIMLFTVFFMSISIQNIYLNYLTYENYKNQQEKISGYLTIPVYANNRSIDGLEANYLELYKRIEGKYEGVLVYARNFYYDAVSDNTLAEEFNQYDVVINENYLKINPIYDESGREITEIDLDKEKINIIVPLSNKEAAMEYKEQMINSYKDDVNVLYYDDVKTKIYSYNSRALKNKEGLIEDAFLIVGNEKVIDESFIYSYITSGSFFFKLDTADSEMEIMSWIKELDLIDTTPCLFTIEENFSEVLSDVKEGLKYYGTQALVLMLSIIATIIFNTRLYCSIFQKKISVCILDGMPIIKCIKGHLIVSLISYAITYIVGMNIINESIAVKPLTIIIMAVVELLVIKIYAKKCVSANMNEMLKGA